MRKGRQKKARPPVNSRGEGPIGLLPDDTLNVVAEGEDPEQDDAVAKTGAAERVGIDGSTISVWGDAMCAALKGERGGLVELLRSGNEVTRDVAEFIAWLLDDKKGKKGMGGRPKLPKKFKELADYNNPLFDAVMDFETQRTHWRFASKRLPDSPKYGRKFPYKQIRAEVARRHRVDEDALETKIRRAATSGRKLGG